MSAAEEEVLLGASSAMPWSKAVGKAAILGEGVEAPEEAVAAAAAEGAKEEAVAEEEHKDGCAAPFSATNDDVSKLAAVRPEGEEDDV